MKFMGRVAYGVELNPSRHS